ncbi:MAG: choline-sulfatase, partial [Gammaproteobacteria bacterium]
DPGHADRAAGLAQETRETWDLDGLDEIIVASQNRRRLVQAALAEGKYRSWDHAPPDESASQYVRFGSGFPEVERRHLWPKF